MNLSQLTDQNLLENTRGLVKQERELIVEICRHLREIERRRLFSTLKYTSLLEYAVAELKYSETQAVRRISAMRLLRDVPGVQDKMATGEINLSHAVLAQTLFTKEKKAGREYSAELKLKLIEKLAGKSVREAQKVVGEINPDMKIKPLTFDMIEDEVLREKLLRAKGKFAHQNPGMSLTELLHKLCDLVLQDSAPVRPRADSKAEVLRQVRRRAGERCEHCGSVHALEVDHILPKARGGKDEPANLRLLCRACNQRAAIEKIGAKKMFGYLKAPVRHYS